MLCFQFIINIESKFYFQTNKNAPNNRIVEIDFDNYAEENWITLVEV